MIETTENAEVNKSDWLLQKERKGIKVFTRKVEGYDVREFKGQVHIDVSAKKAYDFIQNISLWQKWVYQLKKNSVRKIRENSKDDFYVYMEFRVPFVSDRDYCGRCNGEAIENGYKITIEAFPDLLPKQKSNVRIPLNNGHWLITSTGPNSCILEQQTLSYPGGNIPEKLVDLSVVEIPYFTLTKLRKIIS